MATGLGLQQVLLTPQGSPTPEASTAAPAPAVASAHSSALEVTSAATAADGIADIDNNTSAAAADAGLSTGEQALVVSFVVEGSPAAAAGVAEGDLLLAAGGQPVAEQELK